MHEPVSLRGGRDLAESGPVERALVGAVRLAALPLIASAIILASLIFGLGLLIRRSSMLVDRLNKSQRLVPVRHRSLRANGSCKRVGEFAVRNASKRRAGLERFNVEADPLLLVDQCRIDGNASHSEIDQT